MKKILISTGGSGGHVIPAITFYEHLNENFEIFLTTDKRGVKFINQTKYIFTIINVPQLTYDLRGSSYRKAHLCRNDSSN